MDRLVSYSCWRPQTVDFDCVYLNLPCPENVFTFEEPFDGPKLDTLPLSFEVSRFGLLPYFIAALHLWAQVVYIQEKGGRRHTNHRPSNPQASFTQLDEKIDHFHRALPNVMQWSTQNRKTFRYTGQEALFVNFHFLLNHARCVLHQEYLPYRDPTTALYGYPLGNQGGTDTPPEGRDERVVSLCVASSEAIVTMASELSNSGDVAGNGLRSVFAAAAILSAANIQLWLQHVEGSDDESRKRATAKVSKMTTVLESWIPQWSVAATWSNTLTSLRQLYDATYDSNRRLPSIEHNQGLAEVVTDVPQEAGKDGIDDRPPSRLTEGKGLPELKEQMVDKVRFILLASLEDPDAKARVLKASISTTSPDVHGNATLLGDLDFWLPSDMNFGFPDLYLDESWSGIDTAHADDIVARPGPDLEPDDHGY